MPIFGAKSRSWESYLAGIGVSGALMASASVLFVILIGLLTISAWPHAGSLLGGGGAGGETTLQEVATPAPARRPAQFAGLNLTRLLSGGDAGARHAGSSGGRGERGGRVPDGLLSGQGGVSPPGGSNGGGTGQPQGAQQPPPPAAPSQSNVVSRAVSGAGDTVQSTTESLGNTLGGSSSPGLGGVVGGVGNTLNDGLQGLAGNR